MSEPSNSVISAWMPETDPHRLAALGKLAEECNELGARAARCIIQGIDEIDPGTGRTNREEMEREIADVFACIDQATKRLGTRAMHSRIIDKFSGFDRWHDLIDGLNGQTEPSDATLADRVSRGETVL